MLLTNSYNRIYNVILYLNKYIIFFTFIVKSTLVSIISTKHISSTIFIQVDNKSKKSYITTSFVENNSYVRCLVLATEDQAELGAFQSPSEDICQIISSSDVAPPQIDSEHQNVESSPVVTASEVDNTNSEQLPIVTQGTDDPITEKSVPTTQAILDVKQTETVVSKIEEQVSNVVEATLDSAVVTQSIPLTPAQVVSEATTECPVPIQVAESVLQAEPKESVAEDPRPVIEAVVSSIIPPVQESAAAVSETLIEPGRTETSDPAIYPQQLNGDDPSLQSEIEIVGGGPAVMSSALVSRSPNVVSVVHEFAPRMQQQEAQQEAQPPAQEMQPVTQETQPEVHESKVELKVEDSSSVGELEETLSAAGEKVEKSKLIIKLPQAETQSLETEPEHAAVSAEIPSETTEPTSGLDAECPVRPSRSKDLKIPGTPIVIGPTPPTSPPLGTDTTQTVQEEVQKPVQQETDIKTVSEAEVPVTTQADIQGEASAETQAAAPVETQESSKKVVKKMVKKSSAESDSPSSQESEGTGKKVVKKVVKKVKKPKEGEEGEDSSSVDKPKKVIKTGKKLAKTSSSTSLETDKTVPETLPPSASSQVPVPPKRKSKSSAGVKTASKKPEDS